MKLDIRLKLELMDKAQVKVYLQGHVQVQVRFKLKATLQSELSA